MKLLKKAAPSLLLVPGLGAGSVWKGSHWGGLLREAGCVEGDHRRSAQGCLGKTLAALPYSDKPPLSGPAAQAQAELHWVG